jgi:hypothetical protein
LPDAIVARIFANLAYVLYPELHRWFGFFLIQLLFSAFLDHAQILVGLCHFIFVSQLFDVLKTDQRVSTSSDQSTSERSDFNHCVAFRFVIKEPMRIPSPRDRSEKTPKKFVRAAIFRTKLNKSWLGLTKTEANHRSSPTYALLTFSSFSRTFACSIE